MPDYKNSINIVKINIEGAEWLFFNDLIDNNLNQHIDIYCGQGHDVEKVEELKDKVDEYYNLLEKNNIHLYRFTEWKPWKNDDMKNLVKQCVNTESEIKVTNLLDYFRRHNYDWQADKEPLSTICGLTKTRSDPNKKAGSFSYGQEQSFLIKSIAKSIKANNFFEIGTGRGTACYAVSLEDSIESVTTVDIIPHHQKREEAINYRPAVVSNADLYEMIPYEQKKKISFKHITDIPSIIENMENTFDLAFIDGNHTDIKTIIKDFYVCNKLVKDGGTIIFDDYHQSKFVVKRVVDEIMKRNPNFQAELVCQHGHLFECENRTKALDHGVVIIKK